MEILLALALVALLAGLVVPTAQSSLRRGREAALRQDLAVMRKAIDDFRADRGKYPAALALLVTERYLRAIPADPMTGRTDTWVPVHEHEPPGSGGIVDIRSGSDGVSPDGESYSAW